MDKSVNIEQILTLSENTNNENRERELLNLRSDNENLSSTKDDDDNEEKNQKIKDDDLMKRINLDTENKNIPETDNEDDKNLKINLSENQQKEIIKENENFDKSSNNEINNFDEEYSKYVTYNELGEAIYTDPNTNYKYRWSEDKNDWELLQSSSSVNEATNPYENEHYRWCTETNQWIPKNKITINTDKIKSTEEEQKTETTVSSEDTIETEFYKWDKIKNQWIPKTQSSDVVYRFEDGVHTYTDQDGTIFFWDTEKNAWFPKIDDEFMARYQLNYGFIDNTSLNEHSETHKKESVNSDATVKTNTIEKLDFNQEIDGNCDNKPPVKRKAPPEPPKWFDIPPEQNTKVYVSNLPEDITEEEFVQVMSKCGLIMRDPQTHKYKIKLYSEPNGQLKGDGLCDYIKVESVDLALNLLDGYDVRGHKIKVQRAKFQMRGEYNPALKPKKKKKDKEKLQKMKEKLFDWRPEKMRGERSKHERNVIIKNLFDPKLFDKEVHLIIEYQNDLREECSKCGIVKKVVIYDRHPDGVAQVIMSSPEEADLVVQMMHRRFFGQRRLLAEIWDGKTKYKITETETEEQKRLSNWDKFLEEDDQENKEKGKQSEIEKPEKISNFKINEEILESEKLDSSN